MSDIFRPKGQYLGHVNYSDAGEVLAGLVEKHGLSFEELGAHLEAEHGWNYSCGAHTFLLGVRSGTIPLSLEEIAAVENVLDCTDDTLAASFGYGTAPHEYFVTEYSLDDERMQLTIATSDCREHTFSLPRATVSLDAALEQDREGAKMYLAPPLALHVTFAEDGLPRYRLARLEQERYIVRDLAGVLALEIFQDHSLRVVGALPNSLLVEGRPDDAARLGKAYDDVTLERDRVLRPL